MVADECPASCLAAQGQLRELGYNADSVANAKDAFERHCRQPFDLILLDSQMALAQGAEVTVRLRAAGRTCGGPGPPGSGIPPAPPVGTLGS